MGNSGNLLLAGLTMAEKKLDSEWSGELLRNVWYDEWKDTDWKVWENVGKFFRRYKGARLGDGVAEHDFYGIAYQGR